MYKYIKTKIKIYNDKVCTNFYRNKTPKDNEYCTCLSVILLDSCFDNSNKEYYLQILLQESKHVMKNEKIVNTIIEDLELMWYQGKSKFFFKKKHYFSPKS